MKFEERVKAVAEMFMEFVKCVTTIHEHMHDIEDESCMHDFEAGLPKDLRMHDFEDASC